jgi:hypothetical protein
MTRSCSKLFPLFALIGNLCSTSSGNADEPTPNVTETRAVLRISWEFIRKHTLPSIEESAPVNRCLFGAHVTGQAHTKGATTVNMDIVEGDEAVFTFHFKGATITNSVATHNPVAVYSTGTTNFETRRSILFDGLKFTAGPATIQATHSATIDGVAAPRGLRGCIARSIAWGQIRKNKTASDAISLEDTKTRVLASFNRESDRLVNDLNAVVPLEQTVNLLAPQTKDWTTYIARTKEYIMISPGPKEAGIPVLPKEYLQMKAPMELWIHGKPAGESVGRLLEIYGVAHRGLDRFRALTSSKQAHAEGLRFSAVGEWTVIKVGEDLLERWVEKIEGKSEPMK